MVEIVWGPMSACTYRMSEYAGSFVPTHAHKGRWSFAPAASSAFQRRLERAEVRLGDGTVGEGRIGDGGQCRIVVLASHDCLLEDGRIGRHAA
jgi:hypothetical protein